MTAGLRIGTAPGAAGRSARPCAPRAIGRGAALVGGVLLVSLGLMTGCASDGRRFELSQAPVEYGIERWDFGPFEGRKVSTAHYEIYSTLRDEQLLASFPVLMEAAFDYFRFLVPPAMEPDEKMPVYLFATRGQWEIFTRRFAGPRAAAFLRIRNGGYSERGVTVINYTSHQATFPLMAHEGFHQYLYHYVGRWTPAWLNEGLAVACEGQHWDGRRLLGFDRWQNPTRRNKLAEAVLRDEMFPLRDLLATHAGRVVRLSSRAVSTYYAQLWALVLFLEEGEEGRYSGDFRRLCENLARLRPDRPLPPPREPATATGPAPDAGANGSWGERVFAAFFGEDIDQIERRYRAFLRERMIVRP